MLAPLSLFIHQTSPMSNPRPEQATWRYDRTRSASMVESVGSVVRLKARSVGPLPLPLLPPPLAGQSTCFIRARPPRTSNEWDGRREGDWDWAAPRRENAIRLWTVVRACIVPVIVRRRCVGWFHGVGPILLLLGRCGGGHDHVMDVIVFYAWRAVVSRLCQPRGQTKVKRLAFGGTFHIVRAWGRESRKSNAST